MIQANKADRLINLQNVPGWSEAKLQTFAQVPTQPSGINTYNILLTKFLGQRVILDKNIFSEMLCPIFEFGAEGYFGPQYFGWNAEHYFWSCQNF